MAVICLADAQKKTDFLLFVCEISTQLLIHCSVSLLNFPQFHKITDSCFSRLMSLERSICLTGRHWRLVLIWLHCFITAVATEKLLTCPSLWHAMPFVWQTFSHIPHAGNFSQTRGCFSPKEATALRFKNNNIADIVQGFLKICHNEFAFP